MAGRSSLEKLSPQERAAQAARIREAVEEIGTQEQAARVAGVSLSQLKNYLSGRSGANTTALGKLAAASNRRLEWLITGNGAPEMSAKSREDRLTKLAAATGRLDVLQGVLDQSAILSKIASSAGRVVAQSFHGTALATDFQDALIAAVIDVAAPGNIPAEDWETRLNVALELCTALAANLSVET